MNNENFFWYIYVLDTSIDDLVFKCDFEGNLDDLNSKLCYLYNIFNGFDNINIKIIMK